MLDFFADKWNECLQVAGGKVSTVIGTGIATTGICIEQIALVVIIVGILLWFFRITKIFRSGCVGYGAGLILEMIGSLMIK
ncbi:hypothetical protein FDB23_03020 [Clostridium botulinum]|uniref:hypothetical protein n=1 Tax=Clostridium botulinum TaxID=1491 RepID=UPI00145010F2|nr:hypothetical protein [Clostridium botulinum]MBY6948923.1 hypothetical protein [Clostridium botulinum]MBY7022081.1 hypothetical protein [Clostridium botulinum]NFO03093.1 hypothetical protein [Clostridium botulinum]